MIEENLNVLILEHSKDIAEKIVKTLRNIEKTGDILYAPTFDKPINMLLSAKVDIVLCGISLTEENVDRLNKLRAICKPFFLVVLFESTKDDYTKKHPYLSVDFFVNRDEELERLPCIIVQAARSFNKINTYNSTMKFKIQHPEKLHH